jgi:3-oxoacyl-[acyl-carrier protein] reductase
MKSVASDYGDQGININGVSPGMINTRFLDGVGRKIKEFTAASNPKHRNLEVEDVVPTICLLLSDNMEFINGSNINLSGHSE